jgi:hypothetical protein
MVILTTIHKSELYNQLCKLIASILFALNDSVNISGMTIMYSVVVMVNNNRYDPCFQRVYSLMPSLSPITIFIVYK